MHKRDQWEELRLVHCCNGNIEAMLVQCGLRSSPGDEDRLWWKSCMAGRNPSRYVSIYWIIVGDMLWYISPWLISSCQWLNAKEIEFHFSNGVMSRLHCIKPSSNEFYQIIVVIDYLFMVLGFKHIRRDFLNYTITIWHTYRQSIVQSPTTPYHITGLQWRNYFQWIFSPAIKASVGYFNTKISSYQYRNFHYKIRLSHDHFTFIMGSIYQER